MLYFEKFMPHERLTQKHLEMGLELIRSGKLKGIVFSQGTYQAEVIHTKNESHWPFLQVSDEGKIKDAFCDCREDSSSGCSHIAAAYLQVMAQHSIPLHMRFKESFWNHLAQICAHRHGYDERCLQGKVELKALSPTGKLLFSIKAKSASAKAKIAEIILQRVVETEETSLKFFNLPQEELFLWKAGNAGHALQYELSFWSDLAKWWMMMAELKESYKIEFLPQEVGLPRVIKVEFDSVVFSVYIASANWPALIPTLKTVQCPLEVFDTEGDNIESIHYEKTSHCFVIEHQSQGGSPIKEAPLGIDLENYTYVPLQGFFSKKKDAFFQQKKIHSERVAYALSKYRLFFSKHLRNTTIHDGQYSVRYFLSFDEKRNLHITAYIFEPKDFLKPDSAFFGTWAYIDALGFYELQNPQFPLADTIIAEDKVSDFVNTHRVWLNAIEGFQTHLMTIESEMYYLIDKDLSLKFESRFDLIEEKNGVLDFGEWVYIEGKGFFQKEKDRGVSPLRSGLKIPRGEVAPFIKRHSEELRLIPGFFAATCPVEAVWVDVLLTPEEKIRIKPHYQFGVKVDSSRVFFFGEYAYVDKEGFSLMPIQLAMGDFLEEKVLDHRRQNFFLASEIDVLKPYIRLWDPRLKKSSKILLRIAQVQKEEKGKEISWLVDLEYETDHGRVDAVEIWKALHDDKKYLFSSAGLIDVKAARFNWLKAIHKKRWLKGGKQLRLSSLEWIRLSSLEDPIEPQGVTEKDENSRALLEQFRQMNSSSLLSTEGLKSELRLYQEMGLKWLWFLYCNGLSGLLCDEMGLGKTHQAMALLAAARNSEPLGKKFIVVCPTSVIYHWEDLLKKFLPGIKVSVFYGLGRQLASFEEEYDLLLTSYGTLRSERRSVSKIEFDVAVFDEVQYAKNTQSQTHKALKALKCNMVIGLTGTPLENRLMDVKALFEIILPGYLPSEAQFKEFFVNPIEKGEDEERRSLLSKIIKPFILRRKKADVLLELPEKIEEVYYCDLSEEQKRLYREAFYSSRDDIVRELSDTSSSKGYVHVFSILSKLKQICNHPVMISKDIDHFSKYSSGKWDLFIEKLQEALDSGQKVVVFTQYLTMMDVIERYLSSKQISYAEIRGSTRNRREEIERFRDDPSCMVFVASLQAAGAGIELTSASVVIHYDRWWNPAKENQATDRVHRLGQSRGVQVFKLISKKSIEERIHQLIESKSKLFESVIGFDDQDQIKSLSRQELLDLVHLLEKDIE